MQEIYNYNYKNLVTEKVVIFFAFHIVMYKHICVNFNLKLYRNVGLFLCQGTLQLVIC